MTYFVVVLLLIAMFVYICFRKPVWIEQITYNGKKIYICPHCGEIWRPATYNDYQLELTPPHKCPNCNKEVRHT